MAEPAMRVALLARPGAACDNLQAALREAGAEVVLVADPTSSDAGSVAASAPRAVLVALEPSVEDALDRYQDLLQDPATIVIYDEVAVAARREGWDAARWVRHLAAKLGSHHDVLPPGGEADGEPATRPVPARPAEQPHPELHLGVEAGGGERSSQATDGIDFGGFTDEMKMALALDDEAAPEVELASGPDIGIELDLDIGIELDLDIGPDIATAQAPSPAPVAADGLAEGIEWEPLAIPAAPVQAPVAPAPVAPAPSAASTPAPSFANLTLEEISPEPQAPASPAAAESRGGVIVLAGIGGPDAVRQFLSALPLGFPRAVVVRQRLDGGRHDRLVRQMQRATALPVELAQAGARLASGHVYILPEAMTTASGTGAAFVGADGPVPVLAGLPAADSAVLMLSGSDPASVAEVLAAGEAGAFVAAQALEECFDSEAPAALAAAGAAAAPPADLANRLAARWPNP